MTPETTPEVLEELTRLHREAYHYYEAGPDGESYKAGDRFYEAVHRALPALLRDLASARAERDAIFVEMNRAKDDARAFWGERDAARAERDGFRNGQDQAQHLLNLALDDKLSILRSAEEAVACVERERRREGGVR